jgi:hypothetical protein
MWAGCEAWYVREVQVEDCDNCVRAQGYSLDYEFAESPNLVGSSGKRLTTTIRRKLKSMGAYCENGVLYDRWGTKVLFVNAERGATGMTVVVPDWQKQTRTEEEKKVEQFRKEGGRVILMYLVKPPS